MREDELARVQTAHARALTSLESAEAEISVHRDAAAIANANAASSLEALAGAQARAATLEAARSRWEGDVAELERAAEVAAAQRAELVAALEATEARSKALCESLVAERAAAVMANAQRAAAETEKSAARDAERAALSAASASKSDAARARSEADSARATAAEVGRRAATDADAAAEALRIRKERSYALLERSAAAETAAGKAAREAGALVDALRCAHARVTDLEAMVALEVRSSTSLKTSSAEAATALEAARSSERDALSRADAAEAAKRGVEADLCTAGAQLRDMADKVFALLERLASAERARERTAALLRGKEAEVTADKRRLEKMSAALAKETRRGASALAEASASAAEATVARGAASAALTRARNDQKSAAKETEGREAAENAKRTIEARLVTTLARLASEEDSAGAARGQATRSNAEAVAAAERAAACDTAVAASIVERDKSRVDARARADALDALAIRFNALLARLHEGARSSAGVTRVRLTSLAGAEAFATSTDGSTPLEAVLAAALAPTIDEERPVSRAGEDAREDALGDAPAESRLAFSIESHARLGGAVLLRGVGPHSEAVLVRFGVNEALVRAQKSAQFGGVRLPAGSGSALAASLVSTSAGARTALVRYVSRIIARLARAEDAHAADLESVSAAIEKSTILGRVVDALQMRIAEDEETRRRLTLDIVRAAILIAIEPASQGSECVELTNVSVGDEGVAALRAALEGGSGSFGIRDVRLGGTGLTDDGARALASLIAIPLLNAEARPLLAPERIDASRNRLTRVGVAALAEALGSWPHVARVFVRNAHGGGARIEAFAAADATPGGEQHAIANAHHHVALLCVIDCSGQLTPAGVSIQNTVAAETLLAISAGTSINSQLVKDSLTAVAPPRLRDHRSLKSRGRRGTPAPTPPSSNAQSKSLSNDNSNEASATAVVQTDLARTDLDDIATMLIADEETASSTLMMMVDSGANGLDGSTCSADVDSSPSNRTPLIISPQEQRERSRDCRLAIREALWVGRSGGLDIVPIDVAARARAKNFALSPERSSSVLRMSPLNKATDEPIVNATITHETTLLGTVVLCGSDDEASPFSTPTDFFDTQPFQVECATHAADRDAQGALGPPTLNGSFSPDPQIDPQIDANEQNDISLIARALATPLPMTAFGTATTAVKRVKIFSKGGLGGGGDDADAFQAARRALAACDAVIARCTTQPEE